MFDGRTSTHLKKSLYNFLLNIWIRCFTHFSAFLPRTAHSPSCLASFYPHPGPCEILASTHKFRPPALQPSLCHFSQLWHKINKVERRPHPPLQSILARSLDASVHGNPSSLLTLPARFSKLSREQSYNLAFLNM